METQKEEKFKHILCRESTKNEIKRVQARYECLTFDEALLTLIENDAGIPFTLIQQMALQGKTIQDLLNLSKRWRNDQ